MNCGSSAGTIEYPTRPRISATQMAATLAVEGRPGAKVSEFTARDFGLCASAWKRDVPGERSGCGGRTRLSRRGRPSEDWSAFYAVLTLASTRRTAGDSRSRSVCSAQLPATIHQAEVTADERAEYVVPALVADLGDEAAWRRLDQKTTSEPKFAELSAWREGDSNRRSLSRNESASDAVLSR